MQQSLLPASSRIPEVENFSFKSLYSAEPTKQVSLENVRYLVACTWKLQDSKLVPSDFVSFVCFYFTYF